MPCTCYKNFKTNSKVVVLPCLKFVGASNLIRILNLSNKHSNTLGTEMFALGIPMFQRAGMREGEVTPTSTSIFLSYDIKFSHDIFTGFKMASP